MTADQLIHEIESLGGRIVLDGERLRYELPPAAAPLLADLRVHKRAVQQKLRLRSDIPPMPKGVRLLQWQPRRPPVVLTQLSVVIDTYSFIDRTLVELEAALARNNCLDQRFQVRELMERLEQVGVRIELEEQVVGTIAGGGQ